jgi:hypothetical protein
MKWLLAPAAVAAPTGYPIPPRDWDSAAFAGKHQLPVSGPTAAAHAREPLTGAIPRPE